MAPLYNWENENFDNFNFIILFDSSMLMLIHKRHLCDLGEENVVKLVIDMGV